MGAGSVGAYFGGRLARSGHEVFFVARGDHLKAIRRDGLSVESIKGDFHIKAEARESFEPLENLDLIILSVKHRDTESVLPEIKKHTGGKSLVMSLQNGVDSEKTLAGVAPASQLIGGLAYIGANIEAPGKIRHTASGKIVIGELDGSKSERIINLKKIFEEAHIPCSVSLNIEKEKWEKLMWNVGFNGLSALTDRSANELAAYPPTCALVRHLMEELVEVALKAGIEVNRGMIDKHIEFTAKTSEIVPSMLQDTRAGRLSEIDIINGKVVSYGKKFGITTPYNELVWGAISLRDKALLNR